MVTVCPSCKTSIGFIDSGRLEGLKLRCSGCSSVLRIVRKERPGRPSWVPGAQGGSAVRLLVANEQKAFFSTVSDLLAGKGFDLVFCYDGRMALETIKRLKPDAALLDLALPGMYGFEVCEAVRSDPGLASVKLILISSVYDNRRYVRSPGTLYGADAMIEPDRVADSLRELLSRLIPPRCATPSPVAAEPSAASEASGPGPAGNVAVILPDAVTIAAQKLPDPPADLSPDHKKAQRLARVIVSDIALYNKALVEEGVRKGTLYELLGDDIREGRSLYERRVPEDIRRSNSYLEDALSDLIARKKAEIDSISTSA